jgi:hypothetical protein
MSLDDNPFIVGFGPGEQDRRQQEKRCGSQSGSQSGVENLPPRLAPLPPFTGPIAKGALRGTAVPLLDNGEPLPSKEGRNLRRFGWTCPREEFIRSPRKPVIAHLASRWGLSEHMVRKWRIEGGWEDARESYWRLEAVRYHSLEEGQLQQTRVREFVRTSGDWAHMREILMAKLDAGEVEETTASGRKVKREINFKDIKDVALTYKAISEGLEKTLRLSEIVSRLAEFESDNKKNAPTVQRMLINMSQEAPSEDDEDALEGEEEPLALPPSPDSPPLDPEPDPGSTEGPQPYVVE